MELPKRLGWLKSGRFLRLMSGVVGLALLSGVLYNAVMIDRMPPTYQVRVLTTTNNGLAMRLTAIGVVFNETVQTVTAEHAFSMTQLTTGSPAVKGSFSWPQQGLELRFTPSAPLPLSTRFHVHVAAGVQDPAGNTQESTADVDLTTVGLPAVVSVSPADNAQAVPVDSSIQITFDRKMDTQGVIAGLSLTPDVSYQASWSGTLLTLTPTKPLSYGTIYTVRIGAPAGDLDGTKLAPFTSSFRTAAIGLGVTTLVPNPGLSGASIRTQIAVVFNAPIDPSTIAGAITVKPSVSGSMKAITLPDDHNPPNSATPTPSGYGPTVLVFTPDNPLAPSTTYFVTLSSTVKRTDGQVAAGRTWTFVTGEPTVSASGQIAFISHRSGVDNVWLMNSDGSYQREITAELAPVTGFGISGGTIVYGAGGLVKKMSLNGDNLTTLTPQGNLEYAPTITPDGTGVIVGRRDTNGADVGYWRYPLVSGADVRRVAPDGAPVPGSVSIGANGLTGDPGMSRWAPRAALSSDSHTMLVVRGADNMVELVDLTGAADPIHTNLQGDSRPVWIEADGAFYVTGSSDGGSTWSYWQITPTGTVTRMGSSASDIAANGRTLALVVKSSDGSYHVAYTSWPGGLPALLTQDPSFYESSPSFSPDGSAVVFGRAGSGAPSVSAGIWRINVDGSGLTDLTSDGAFPTWVT